MPSVHVSETIQAPRERVFDLFSDLSGLEERIRGIEKIEDEGEGTRVAIDFVSTPESFLARLLSPLARLATKTVARCLLDDMRDLKAVAEAEAGAA